jgi:hypothetical protein
MLCGKNISQRHHRPRVKPEYIIEYEVLDVMIINGRTFAETFAFHVGG